MSINKKYFRAVNLIEEGVDKGMLKNMAFVVMCYDNHTNKIHVSYRKDAGVSDSNFIRGNITVLNHLKDNPNG